MLWMRRLYHFSSKKSRIHYQQYPIQQYEVGQRLDRYLKVKSLISWSVCQKLIRNRDISIRNSLGEQINNNSHIFQKGDMLLINENLKTIFKDSTVQTNIPFQKAKQLLDKMIIFDNQNITILNKQAGYTVQGGEYPQQNLFSLMATRFKKQFVHITHRLDKPTSGILMFAKNFRTAQLLQTNIEQRKCFHKYYLGITTGQEIIPSKGYIRANIKWSSNDTRAKLAPQTRLQSKDCVTYYSQINQINNYKIIGMKLLTGRKHQLRCHLGSFLNNPIVNDLKYRGVKAEELKQDEIYLHAFHTIIDNKQIVEDVFGDIDTIENKNGKIIKQDNRIKIYGTIPESWRINSLDVQTIGNKLSEQQYQNRKYLQRKAKITTIT